MYGGKKPIMTLQFLHGQRYTRSENKTEKECRKPLRKIGGFGQKSPQHLLTVNIIKQLNWKWKSALIMHGAQYG